MKAFATGHPRDDFSNFRDDLRRSRTGPREAAPADVCFLLGSPANISGPHIKARARISRLLKNEDFKKRLTAASSPEELIGEISEEEKKNQPR